MPKAPDIETLLRIAGDLAAEDRAAALHALSAVDDLRVEAVLLAALREPTLEPDARASAVFAAGEHRITEAWDDIASGLGAQDSIDRAFALTALSRIDPVRALPHARKRLAGEADPMVRALAASCLRDARDAESVDLLINRLTDEDTHVRKAAADALGTIADPRAFEPLRQQTTGSAVLKALWTADFSVYAAARKALRAIENAHPELRR